MWQVLHSNSTPTACVSSADQEKGPPGLGHGPHHKHFTETAVPGAALPLYPGCSSDPLSPVPGLCGAGASSSRHGVGALMALGREADVVQPNNIGD